MNAEIANKLDVSFLEELNDIVSENDCFHRKIKKVNKGKNLKYSYQYFNQFCTCIIRIRETVDYLKVFDFRKDNECRQAFDFYEFINCCAIITGCIQVLFQIFDTSLESCYPNSKKFVVSNRTKNSDIKFFNFIRSAASMHPAETTLHKKITKHKFEAYPYAIWVEPGCLSPLLDRPKDVDIELLGWGSKTRSKNKYYYLKSSEFYDYIAELLRTIRHLIPIANNIVEENREKNRCKTLKNPTAFNNFSEYCLYLRKRIYIKLSGDEIPDGGLLLASHILENEKIDNHFKKWIKTRVLSIANKMLQDINSIEYDEIFSELYLGGALKCENAHYISEKFHDYLYNETIREIETNRFVAFKSSLRIEENNLNYSNPEWSVIKLIDSNDPEILNAIKKADSYTDLYELVLEIIYKRTSN